MTCFKFRVSIHNSNWEANLEVKTPIYNLETEIFNILQEANIFKAVEVERGSLITILTLVHPLFTCYKRRGLIYAEFIVGFIQQIFSEQVSGITCKYHAYVIFLLPVIE